MGFNLRQLRKTSSAVSASNAGPTKIKHLIIGESFIPYLVHQFLISKQEPALLLCQHALSSAEREKRWDASISMLRGSDPAWLKHFFPSLIPIPISEQCFFYKDTEWKIFGGRSRSFTLGEGEEFFSQPGFHLSWKDMLSHFGVDQGKEKTIEGIIQTVEKINEDWVVTLSSGEKIVAEFLYWGKIPRKFLDSLVNSDQYPNSLHQFCFERKGFKVAHLSMSFSAPLTSLSHGTYFVPQSQTHELGHFLFESHPQNPLCWRALVFLQEEEQAEDIAKKLKNLKRAWQKMVPESRELLVDEAVYFQEEDFSLAEESSFSMEQNGLFFLGPWCPLPQTLEDLHWPQSPFLRGLEFLNRLEISLQ